MVAKAKRVNEPRAEKRERGAGKMAEVVHRNLEAMLPQLEALESTGVFSHDEIK